MRYSKAARTAELARKGTIEKKNETEEVTKDQCIVKGRLKLVKVRVIPSFGQI